MSLPPIHDLPANLGTALATLFEPSPTLYSLLLPVVRSSLDADSITSYSELVDRCAEIAKGWTYDQKAAFVAGHPMIGEVSNLSALSHKEQASVATRPVVLKRYVTTLTVLTWLTLFFRLAHLNEVYCAAFPGLRYITFVNGRPRSAIVNEMERSIGVPVSPDPLPEDYPVTEPALSEASGLVRPRDSEAWKTECDRAIGDVWLIAKARIWGMGLE